MSGWDACTMEQNHWLRWIECHPGLAGYLQAVGVVGTLVLALLGPLVARWIGRFRERRARNAKTLSLARSLLPHVNTLLERIHGRLETLGTYSEPEGNDWGLFLQNMMIEIPGPLDIRFSGFDLDQARLAFYARLVEEARGYDNTLGNKQREGAREGEWGALRRAIHADLTKLRELALDASAKIRDM
ncbi:MAG TPA: hypothetical protein VGG48_19640 [Rhizomicrobium sp.]|jgi:hypothetical protein